MSRIVCLDPGDTTGWSAWEPAEPLEAVAGGQHNPWHVYDALAAAAGLTEAMLSSAAFRHVQHRPDPELVAAFEGWGTIVCEDWSLYPDPANPATTVLPMWDKCLTARYIGGFNFLARLCGKRFILQPAAIKDEAVKLSAQELFVRPLHDNRHQNDSIMHWVRYAAGEGLLHGTGGAA